METDHHRHERMLLDRMRIDCDYFLGASRAFEPHLHGRTVEDHISGMRLRLGALPESERPDFLTAEDIDAYEKRMLAEREVRAAQESGDGAAFEAALEKAWAAVPAGEKLSNLGTDSYMGDYARRLLEKGGASPAEVADAMGTKTKEWLDMRAEADEFFAEEMPPARPVRPIPPERTLTVAVNGRDMQLPVPAAMLDGAIAAELDAHGEVSVGRVSREGLGRWDVLGHTAEKDLRRLNQMAAIAATMDEEQLEAADAYWSAVKRGPLTGLAILGFEGLSFTPYDYLVTEGTTPAEEMTPAEKFGRSFLETVHGVPYLAYFNYDIGEYGRHEGNGAYRLYPQGALDLQAPWAGLSSVSDEAIRRELYDAWASFEPERTIAGDGSVDVTFTAPGTGRTVTLAMPAERGDVRAAYLELTDNGRRDFALVDVAAPLSLYTDGQELDFEKAFSGDTMEDINDAVRMLTAIDPGDLPPVYAALAEEEPSARVVMAAVAARDEVPFMDYLEGLPYDMAPEEKLGRTLYPDEFESEPATAVLVKCGYDVAAFGQSLEGTFALGPHGAVDLEWNNIDAASRKEIMLDFDSRAEDALEEIGREWHAVAEAPEEDYIEPHEREIATRAEALLSSAFEAVEIAEELQKQAAAAFAGPLEGSYEAAAVSRSAAAARANLEAYAEELQGFAERVLNGLPAMAGDESAEPFLAALSEEGAQLASVAESLALALDEIASQPQRAATELTFMAPLTAANRASETLGRPHLAAYDAHMRALADDMEAPADAEPSAPDYSKVTRQGWTIIDRRGDDVLVFRPNSEQAFAVGSGYSAETGSWGQGFYTSDLGAALDRLNGEEVRADAARTLADVREELEAELQLTGGEPDRARAEELVGEFVRGAVMGSGEGLAREITEAIAAGLLLSIGITGAGAGAPDAPAPIVETEPDRALREEARRDDSGFRTAPAVLLGAGPEDEWNWIVNPKGGGSLTDAGGNVHIEVNADRGEVRHNGELLHGATSWTLDHDDAMIALEAYVAREEGLPYAPPEGTTWDSLISDASKDLWRFYDQKGPSLVRPNFPLGSFQNYQQELEDTINDVREYGPREALCVSKTPGILIALGMEDRPLLLHKNKVHRIMKPKEDGEHYHGITRQQLLQLPELLASPAIVLDTLSTATRQDAVVVVLNLTDADDLPMVAAIEPNGKAEYNFEVIETNQVLSLYGRNNLEGYLGRAAEEGKILYVDKQKTEELEMVSQLQLLQSISGLPLNQIIHRSAVIDKAEGLQAGDVSVEEPVMQGSRGDDLEALFAPVTYDDAHLFGVRPDPALTPAQRRAARRHDLMAQGLVEDAPEPKAHPKAIVVDTETTGLDATTDSILSVAVTDTEGNELFYSLVCPDASVTAWPEAQAVNGISPDDVIAKPSIEAVAEALIPLFEQAETVIGHNVGFDCAFLERAGIPIPERMFDTCSQFAPVYGNWDAEKERWRYPKLADAVAFCGGELADAHNSLADAKAAALVYRECEAHKESVEALEAACGRGGEIVPAPIACPRADIEPIPDAQSHVRYAVPITATAEGRVWATCAQEDIALGDESHMVTGPMEVHIAGKVYGNVSPAAVAEGYRMKPGEGRPGKASADAQEAPGRACARAKDTARKAGLIAGIKERFQQRDGRC